MFFIIVYLVVLAIIAIAGFVLVDGWRSKGRIARALGMSLFLVTLPRENPSPNQRPDRELIAVMEQLYASFTGIHSGGWNKFLYGEPYIALEMAVHHVGEEIHFYVAVPRSYEQIFEKQVHGLYPTADVRRVPDYGIFNPHGISAGTYLTMKADAILPFKTYAKLESDPLGGLIAALSKLEREGEGAAIQILIRPSHRQDIRTLAQKVAREMQGGLDFSKALIAARSKKKEQTSSDPALAQPRVVTAFEDELIKALQNKASRPLYDANIRILVSAADETRARQILDDATGAFVQFSAPDLNSFSINKVTGKALEKLIFNYAFRLFDPSRAAYLSSEEIASIYHFPLPASQAPRVKFLKSKAAEPPPNLPDTGIVIGNNVFRGVEKPVRMTDTDRRRHLYVVGQTGVGKSSFMKYMLEQDIKAGKGVCVIDPHGEFAEYVLSVVPRERAEDVVYFDPGDVERPMGLNMLEMDPKHPEQKTMIIDELFGIFDKLYDLKTTGGPMFEKYFKNSLYLLLDDYVHDIPVLADVARVLNNDHYRADKLTRETNPLVREFWKLEAEKATGDQSLSNFSPYITSKLNNFIFNEFLRPIINQKTSAFNFRDIMDNQKILVVNLSKGKIGDLNASFIGLIVVGKLLRAALSRVDISDENERKDFYLYIDEFQNFTTDSIATILSEARKYRLDLVIAHQFIKQLKEPIRDAVFGNVGSMAVFRVGSDDAEFLKNQFEPVFTPQDLVNIDNFNAHVKLLINNQTTRPFTIQTIREPDGRADVRDALRELSRLKYGRPRADVEADLVAGYASPTP